ncbi:MAG: pyridoxamine 5'-phosphate oxidase family protein [Bryobacteraceae bacterium]
MKDPLAEAALLLDSQRAMVLSVATADGGSHAAPVYFVRAGGFALYWLSSPESLHSREIARTGAAAAAVFRPSRRWTDLRGIQMRGRASRVRKSRAILEKYREKFGLGRELDAVIARSSLYVIEPVWMRLIDNRRGFGWNMEWDFSTDQQRNRK